MLVLDFYLSRGAQIGHARRFTEEEKKHYLPWYAEAGFRGEGDWEQLPYITWEDIPQRKEDGCFSGNDGNRTWIISEKEAEHFRALNSGRKEEAERKEAERKAAEKAQQEKEKQEYEACKAQFDRWTSSEIKRVNGDLHCTDTFVIHGKTFKFVERNLFDCGNCLNVLSDDPEKNHAYYTIEDGKPVWKTENKTFPMDNDEITCVRAACKYGKVMQIGIRL